MLGSCAAAPVRAVTRVAAAMRNCSGCFAVCAHAIGHADMISFRYQGLVFPACSCPCQHRNPTNQKWCCGDKTHFVSSCQSCASTCACWSHSCSLKVLTSLPRAKQHRVTRTCAHVSALSVQHMPLVPGSTQVLTKHACTQRRACLHAPLVRQFQYNQACPAQCHLDPGANVQAESDTSSSILLIKGPRFHVPSMTLDL